MTVSVTLSLDDLTVEAIDRMAAQADTTRELLVAQALRDLVAQQDQQKARIADGLAAAERGDFASDAEVEQVRLKFAAR